MITYIIQYRSYPSDGNDWGYSCLNNNEPFINFPDAIVALFLNAAELIKRFLNIPRNDYRIVDSLGEQHFFCSFSEFEQMVKHFMQNTNNQFQILT